MSKWIQKGDQVKVIAGNDKGTQGEVLRRFEERVLVKGVNIRKKHMKRTQEAQNPRIVEMEVPIHISNVALCDAEGNRLKLKKETKGKEKQLLARKKGSKETAVHRTVRKSG
ncbi:MAG TPA: 50S ribosomal protein L24 [Chlamydiales bacterium]|nr:50S ribosomal protein L24 [Chlamydiales bacterium]